jgi:hypothetical protein
VSWVLGTLLVLQLLLPFRHWLYPGHVNWTGEGHYFAWRMMLVQSTITAQVTYRVRPVEPFQYVNLNDWMNPDQQQQMKRKPDQYILLAHRVAASVQEAHPGTQPEVRLLLNKSVNGRRYQLVLPDTLNAATVPYSSWRPFPHFLPYNDSLPPGELWGLMPDNL